MPAGGRYICAANVHMTMEAFDDPVFRRSINEADLVLPDGVPLVWALRALGLEQRRRVRVTPDLLLPLFAACEAHHVKVGLYGSTPVTLSAFVKFLEDATPDLDIAFRHSPPFRPLSPSEDLEITEQIESSGAQLLLVGLGCPKQERWMAEHSDRLHCVMFGVAPRSTCSPETRRTHLSGCGTGGSSGCSAWRLSHGGSGGVTSSTTRAFWRSSCVKS